MNFSIHCFNRIDSKACRSSSQEGNIATSSFLAYTHLGPGLVRCVAVPHAHGHTVRMGAEPMGDFVFYAFPAAVPGTVCMTVADDSSKVLLSDPGIPLPPGLPSRCYTHFRCKVSFYPPLSIISKFLDLSPPKFPSSSRISFLGILICGGSL